MTTQQLIEMAVLDALALLDDDERLDFEKSFRSSTPEVQSHIRREQTRLCNIEAILPNVDPPAGLRAAVLAAVRSEIAIQTESAHDSILMPARRVSPLWRAATVGLATAAVVLGGSFVFLRQQIGDINRRIDNLDVIDTVQSELGRNYATAVSDPTFHKVAFRPLRASVVGTAVMFVNEETNTIYLDCQQLPIQENRSYTLVLIDGQGRETELAKFTSDGGSEKSEIKREFTLTRDSVLKVMASDPFSGQRTPMFESPDNAFWKL